MKTYSYTLSYKEFLSDLYTPVSVYLRVRDISSRSVLMECSDFHSGHNSRSYIAFDPVAGVSIEHGTGICNYPDGTRSERAVDASFTADKLINQFMGSFVIDTPQDTCAPVSLWGYTSFNAVRYFENIAVKDETQVKGDAPDMQYTLFRFVIVFDHFTDHMYLMELVGDGQAPSMERVEKLLSRHISDHNHFRPVGPVSSTLTDNEHRDNIRRGIAHCLRGDVFQIVLSRRFMQRYEGDDFCLYRALRSINPSPYLFYMDYADFRIFGSSPETHCRIENGRAYIDPIAGTVRRTGNHADDAAAAEYLRNDAKENAEHVMLVDLARNDLSRNCHDVRVDFFKEMQYYSHVIHLVSRVSGEPYPGTDPVKIFIDTFPAGTLSGAPKVRAMQLISEYEPHCRGAYGGCIGSISFDGSLNQAITIRSFVSRNQELWFQAGGGIVAQSDPDYELQEVNNKLGALRKAINAAAEL